MEEQDRPSFEAILNGERNPQKLAELSDCRIHAIKEEIAKSLQGNWRPELLFIVRQQLEMYEAYQRRIAECDQEFTGTSGKVRKCPINIRRYVQCSSE